jgi:DivIVA domain-containing protein
LTADLVRTARFGRRPWGRGGLDPEEVAAFLREVADELDLREREVATAWAELDRVKAALRDWQTRNAQAAGRPVAGDVTQGAGDG